MQETLNVSQNQVSEIEQEFYYFMNDKSGNFTTSLFKTIFCADTINRYKLSISYPEHVQIVMDYRFSENYWEDLQNKILFHPHIF
jgi:hypothetical protein